jgi:hypothetical protein
MSDTKQFLDEIMPRVHEAETRLKVALPLLAGQRLSSVEGQGMGRVILGADPHQKL